MDAYNDDDAHKYISCVDANSALDGQSGYNKANEILCYNFFISGSLANDSSSTLEKRRREIKFPRNFSYDFYGASDILGN